MSVSLLTASSEGLTAPIAPVTAAPFSWACWFNTPTAAAAQVMLSISDVSVTSQSFVLQTTTGNQIQHYAFTGGFGIATTSTTWSLNTWHHAIGVEESSTSRYAYLDNGGEGTNSTNRVPSGLDTTSVGYLNRPSTGGHFEGRIAEFGLWNVVLTPGERAALAAGYRPIEIRPESLQVYMPLVRGAPWNDLVTGTAFTETVTPDVGTHPRVIYSLPRQWPRREPEPSIASSSCFVRTGTAALRSGTGTQDLTISGLSETPKALRIGIQLSTTLGTEATNTAASWAVADDSGNCAFIGVSCEDGTTTNNTDRASHLIGSTIELIDGAGTLSTVITIDSDDASAGPIAGGWRVNVTTNGDVGAYLTYTVIGGDGVSTLVDAWVQNATQDAATTRTIGFESNLILPMCIGNASQDTLTTNMRLGLGAAAWDGSTITQGSVLWRSNNNAATSSLATTISDDDCGGEGSAYAVEVTSVTSTQVEFTTRDGANSGNDYVAALFVSLPDGVGVYVSVENSPTSAASDWTVSGVGFKPQFAEAITTFVSSYSSPGLQVTDSEANLVGVHTIDEDNNQTSISMFYEDNASTHNGNVYADDRFISSYNASNTVRAFNMSPSSAPFNTDGFTIAAGDITAVDSTARAWLIWALARVPTEVALTGTITTATETDIEDGGQTIILTLTNDTWVASGATFNAVRQDILDGLDSAGSEVNGWNAEVRDKEDVSAVVRTSDTVVTITLSAAADYNITEDETITATIPASALAGAESAAVADPTFTITDVAEPVTATTGGWDERRRRRGRDVYQEQAERARRRPEAEPEPGTASSEPQRAPEKPALDTAEAQRLMAALEAIEKQQAALEDVRAAAQRRAEAAQRKADAEADAARRAELEAEVVAMEAESARLEAELARRRRVVAALLLLTI